MFSMMVLSDLNIPEWEQGATGLVPWNWFPLAGDVFPYFCRSRQVALNAGKLGILLLRTNSLGHH